MGQIDSNEKSGESDTGKSDTSNLKINFLTKDYDLKINYLTSHLNRMWQRFNFFIALESALSAALFGFFNGKEGISDYAIVIAIIGAVSSACWYIFGAQDRCLASFYRMQVKDSGRIIAKKLELDDFPESKYVHVGYQPEKFEQKWYIYQWRINSISTTKLAALFPLLVVIYWIIIIVYVMR